MLKNVFHERRRSLAVKGLGVLDTPAEPSFDRFVNEAAAAFDAPIALLSLIHSDEQWVKARHGLTLSCIPRDSGFCGHAIDHEGALECCDPQSDPRFGTLAVVTGDPFIRYYIGAPLRLLNGIDVGALCVVDTVRRPPASPDQRAYLLGLARQAAMVLEARADLHRAGVAA
ncbi:GAF domain-containing protein [Sphingomonas sp. R86521]|uniref:GAF domain-containing protein n=1 Tax=Sphingomonas sp. R86521 TaxID=3093860 RepID=UPI0036D2ECA6